MRDTVLGILSMIFWSLAIVISVKYLFFILRANNDGEGGIIALTETGFGPSRLLATPAVFHDRTDLLAARKELGHVEHY